MRPETQDQRLEKRERKSVRMCAERASLSEEDVVTMARHLVAIITEDPRVADSEAEQDHILRLWWQVGGDIDVFFEDVRKVQWAAKDSPDPTFARDIRGENWPGRRDCSRNVATICRFAPDEGTGATYYERLRAAEAFIERATSEAIDKLDITVDGLRKACVDETRSVEVHQNPHSRR